MVKQVIILRQDLNMSTGKAIAQGAHASCDAIRFMNAKQGELRYDWLMSGQTKIVLGCKNQEELDKLHSKAVDADLPCSRITDEGRTEFDQPTVTCIAIGPASVEEIDKITKRLRLY